MNKQEFINRVAETAGLSKNDAKNAVNAVLETITTEVANGQEVSFTGFGKFTSVNRAARTAKIPGTNTTVEVPATVVPKFKVGAVFKSAVQG